MRLPVYPPRRRPVLALGLGMSLGLLSLGPTNSVAQTRPLPLPPMTDGPFYPPRRWRDAGPLTDWDADLTQVRQGSRTLTAEGETLALLAKVQDSQGRPIDRCEVEIWQCDSRGTYRHPRVDQAQADPGFQGFGVATSSSQGDVRLRTIKPAVYPGRTPHIHVKLRHASFGEWTSQLFVEGEPGNSSDFLWRSLKPAERQAAAMRLQAGSADTGVRWVVQHALVVPAG
jgi:protocatechuate 3,4-dioxygenase beta subunit